MVKHARCKAPKVAVVEVTKMVLNLIEDTTRVDQKKNDRVNKCKRLRLLVLLGKLYRNKRGKMKKATTRKEMSLTIRYESYNLIYQKLC